MPRVLMTADAVGGVWTYVLELARALAPQGLSVTLAVMGPRPTDAQISDAASIPNLELEWRPYRLEWTDDAWDDVARAGTWLLELESRVQPVVVHLNGYVHGALLFRAPVIVVGHSCVRSWNDAVGGSFEPRWFERYRELVARGLASADAVVAPSHAMLAALRHHYGPLPHGSVVPNGRNPDLFPAAAKEPIVFAAGRLWDRAKNVAALVRIAPRLPWRVVIAGDAQMQDVLDARMASRAHAGTCRAAMATAARLRTPEFVGRLSQQEVAAWLARASIVALPVRYEPFGLLALEAALAGCALVLGNILSQHEVWSDAATFVDPDSDDQIERAIRRLMANPEVLDRAASRARARALGYSPVRMASGYRAVYDLACARQPATGRRIPCVS